LEIHHAEIIGRSKGVTVFLKPGQSVDESYDVSVQPVNLQKAFVALCGEEGHA
jgi:ABC-2 type transport system ATP-binding protein